MDRLTQRGTGLVAMAAAPEQLTQPFPEHRAGAFERENGQHGTGFPPARQQVGIGGTGHPHLAQHADERAGRNGRIAIRVVGGICLRHAVRIVVHETGPTKILPRR